MIMKKPIKLFLIAAVAIGVLGIAGCENHQERYDTPPWLGGSSIETLQERGNYTIFLDLMEKANYKEPISKQLYTLFVPNDEAFRAYFKTYGINSVADLTKDEAVSLFTLHVLRNPRSRFQLIYEWAWSELQGPKGEYASLFHRKITPSTSTPYFEKVLYSPPSMLGQDLLIYSGNKNIPLFTEEFFNDYGGAADGSDYLFMFPGSTWKKDYASNLKGMNWHNAMVLPNPEIPDELEVRTASGFIYFIDRVVGPMPSIEEYLRDNPDKYGLYYDILQRFAQYGNSKVDEQNRVEYRKSYDLVFDLAEELGPSTNTAVPPQNMWTAFIPTNQVLQDYLDRTIYKYYTSLDSVPRVTLYYILQTQLSGNMVVMSKLKNGYFNSFGDETDMRPSDITSGFMCSNGPVYESKKVMEPNVFTCVPGILFVDKNYSTLLYVLNTTNMLSQLSNPNQHVTLFASTNEALEEYGVRFNSLSNVVEFRGPVDGKWSPMNTTDLNYFAQDQIVKGRVSDYTGEPKFVETTSKNFVSYGNNAVSQGENQFTGNVPNVTEVIENDRNGFVVKVDKPIESRYVMGKYLLSDPEVSEFADLLVTAKLLDARYKDPITKETIPNLKFLAAGLYWTGFIPTNVAMQKARDEGVIPAKYPSSTAGRDSINKFLQYHFVIGKTIFDDGNNSGTFNTYSSYRDDEGKTNYYTLSVSNIPNNLSIYDNAEQVVFLNHSKANYLTRKGVCHKIDTVLKYYK